MPFLCSCPLCNKVSLQKGCVGWKSWGREKVWKGVWMNGVRDWGDSGAGVWWHLLYGLNHFSTLHSSLQYQYQALKCTQLPSLSTIYLLYQTLCCGNLSTVHIRCHILTLHCSTSPLYRHPLSSVLQCWPRPTTSSSVSLSSSTLTPSTPNIHGAQVLMRSQVYIQRHTRRAPRLLECCYWSAGVADKNWGLCLMRLLLVIQRWCELRLFCKKDS